MLDRIKLTSNLPQVNFGDVFIPANLKAPKARVLPEFSRLAHGLRSGNITILDCKTIYIPNLHYDGAGPDAYFWVGNGSEPNTFGIKVPSERQRYVVLDPFHPFELSFRLRALRIKSEHSHFTAWRH